MKIEAIQSAKNWDALEPLRERAFRTIWSASVVANFGQLILGVGAAWEMTRLGTSAAMIAMEAREPPMSGLPVATRTVPSALTCSVALDSPPPLNQ